MDLNQNKLTRAEWETIEKPVSQNEKKVLELIIKGYNDTEIKLNDTRTFLSFTKIEKSPEIDYFVFKKYFEHSMQHAINKYGKGTTISNISEMNFMSGSDIKHLKSSDSIRIQNAEQNIQNNKEKIFEYILVELFVQLLKSFYKKKKDCSLYLYTLVQIKKSTISDINKFVLNYIDKVIDIIKNQLRIKDIVFDAYELIEKNKYLMKYSDMELYSHQKKIFKIFARLANVDKVNESFVSL